MYLEEQRGLALNSYYNVINRFMSVRWSKLLNAAKREKSSGQACFVLFCVCVSLSVFFSSFYIRTMQLYYLSYMG